MSKFLIAFLKHIQPVTFGCLKCYHFPNNSFENKSLWIYVGINWKESFKLNFVRNKEVRISCITDYVIGLVLYDVKIDFTISPEQNSCKVIFYFIPNFIAAGFLYPSVSLMIQLREY